MMRKVCSLALLIAALLLSACAGTATPSTGSGTTEGWLSSVEASRVVEGVAFTPYITPTPRASQTPTPPGTATPLPTPSPTPRQHTVARGEDMGGIAFRYGISLETLMTANPNVNPGAMSIGTLLVIPGSANPDAGSPTGIPSLTPLPLETAAVHCATTREGGVWCFLPLRNTSATALENLSGVIRLADSSSGQIFSQTALPPLDVLPAGASMPLTAYFPPPAPAQFTAGGELRTAMPVSGQNRYLDVNLSGAQVEIAADGQSARVRGAVRLADATAEARQVWVAAMAYDAAGQVIGTRRWESDAPLAAGAEAAFDFAVYSTGAPVQRVELLAQARP